jgi:hypothetical protein
MLYRQTLNLLTKSENFGRMVRYVFDEQAVLPKWKTDLAALSQAISTLQKAQKDNSPPEQLKLQPQATEKAWEQLVTRINALPRGQYVLLQSDAAQVDQVIFRLAQLVGVKLGRTPLPDPLAF